MPYGSGTLAGWGERVAALFTAKGEAPKHSGPGSSGSPGEATSLRWYTSSPPAPRSTSDDADRRADPCERIDERRLRQRQPGAAVRRRLRGHAGVAVQSPAGVPVRGVRQPALVRHRPGADLLAVDREAPGRRAEVRVLRPTPVELWTARTSLAPSTTSTTPL